ncbi:unnamed protein product [Urochloa decumbens]|uniref:NB-ARC domain-containing protein n=1 Tax=Urochloa decumbens TaxID=240449 RepID=A0ABC9BUL0_9POAL
MELFSAIVGDLVSRSLSFMIDRYLKAEPSVDDSLRRLHQLLLRIRTIVEEAEGRNVTNPGMICQLKVLREEMFRGYCVLDAFKYRTLRRDESRDEEEVSHSFALSRFNQAKRIRFSSSSSNTPPSIVVSMKDLQKMVSGLEDIIGDTKEFVVFLMSYPPSPLYRQPYSMHLYLDKCMFSRHMEREHVIAFLLSSSRDHDHLCAESVEVLPIVGPPQVGKSTLVENVCADERVRKHFSLILYYSAENLDAEKASSFSETCVTKHQNNDAVDGRLLVIMELVGDVDDKAWKKLCSSSPHPQGSKIIITSQSEEITRLGTTQALRLQQLQFEAFWYFFKVLVFGSTDPEEHPRLASMAMEMATELRGCFMCAHIAGALLRDNFTAQFWRRLLAFSREYKKYPFASSNCQDGTSTKDHPRHGWEIAKSKPAKYFLLRNSYQKALAQDDGPKITLADLLFGSVKRRGRFEVLVWKSYIPPYYSYISNCTLV